MAIDLTAGFTQPQTGINLSAGLSPSPKIDLSAGLTELNTDSRFFTPGGGPATISAYQPTLWDRIKNAVTAGIPNYSSRTVYNPKYGQTQIVSPEEAMTPSEQQRHPILTGAGEVAGGLTTPQSVALLAGTGGLGELPGAAAMLPRLLSAGFGAQAIYSAYKTVPEIRAAAGRGDVAEVERLLTHLTLNSAMGYLAGRHVVAGKAPISNASRAEAVSPASEVLHDVPESVRIADSSAAAHDLVEADTVKRPEINMRDYPVNDPALASLEAQVRGRADEIAKKYPAARVVSEDHTSVVSRDEILAQAVQNIVNNSAELQKIGVDSSTFKSQGDIDSALQIASDHVASNLDPRASAVITLEGQKQLASDLGLSVEELLSRRRGEAFNAEQLVAARALLNASNANVLKLANAATESSDATSLSAFTDALAQHKAIEETIAGVRAEAGRALGSFRVDKADLPTAKIANVFDKLKPEVKAETARLMSRFDPSDPQSGRKLNQFIAEMTPSTTLEKLHEYYRNALLSSPHTLTVKTASEASMIAMELAKKVVAGGIEKFKDSPDRFASEAFYYAKGMAQALSEHSKPILSGEFQLAGSPGFERTPTHAIKGTPGKIVRAPSEAMSRMTNLMYAGNYFGEINSLAAREALKEGLSGDDFHARQEYLAHHPTPEMSEAAHKLATTNTFQRELGSIGQKIHSIIETKPNAAWLPDSLKKVGPLRFLFPFDRTPMNLLKASLTHATPYELLNGIAKGDTDAMARGVVGSSIATALAYLALNGRITGGGPMDFRKAETKRATGWQPYSVKIGDKYVSYRRFEPVGLVAGLIADAIHGMSKGDSEVVSQSKADTAIKHIMRNLDDFPFLGTLANLVQAVHDPVGGRAQTFINREAGSLVPAAVANIAETTDPTVRRPATALQAVESRIPGLTNAAPAVIDISGKPIQRPTNTLGGANPFPVSTAKGDAVLDELSRLGISTPQPPASLKWRGKQTALTDAERQRFAEQEGQELYQRVAKLVQSSTWQRRSDDAKRKAIIEVHRQIDEGRAQRLTKIRRNAQAELARSSL